jgi:hypothetical protein
MGAIAMLRNMGAARLHDVRIVREGIAAARALVTRRC